MLGKNLLERQRCLGLKTEEKSTLAMIKDEEERTFKKEEYASIGRLVYYREVREEGYAVKEREDAAYKSAQETHAEYSKKS